MCQGYENDIIWRQIQEYLPKNNRINDNNAPKEEWLEIGQNKIHIDHYVCHDAKGTIVIYHGVGGNGRLLSFIAVSLYKAGYEVICPDLPLYGHTVCGGKTTYSDWVDCGTEIAKKYRQNDKPLFLFGLSAGGMLAYQISCRLENVDGLMLTCILDQRIKKVTKETASSSMMATVGKLFLKVMHRVLGGVKIPMKMVCNMKAIVNNEALAELLMSDPISSGSKVTLEFLYGMLNPNIEIEAADYKKCPVLLAHPEKDYWTDVALSRLFFDKIQVLKELKLLQGAGHFPIEEEGLKQLEEYCSNFMKRE